MTPTAVVILNYNGQELLRQFLPSLIAYSIGARVVVVDNQSTDASLRILKEEFPSVDIIVVPENRGYCGGYNYALQQIPETYCVLINSDIEVTHGWLTPLVALLDNNPVIGAVQPKLLAYHDKGSFEYAGAAGGHLDVLGYPFCRGRIFNELEKDEGQYDDCTQIFWASGACFIIRTKLFAEMGGLDEDFFAHMEEIDFCWKLNRSGYQVYYQAKSTVYHIGGGTLAKSNPKKTYLNFRNGLSLIFKHWTTREILMKFPVRILLDWLAAIKFLLLDRSPADAFSVAKAHYHFVKNFANDKKKRAALQRRFFTEKPLLIFPKSIVRLFYLSGKKSFRQLHGQ
jgi:GT2 family glycosyltransferase